MTESAPDALPQSPITRSDWTDQNMGAALSRVLFGDEVQAGSATPTQDTEVDRG